jgi:tetratricopeptide (TPR) repeat protein
MKKQKGHILTLLIFIFITNLIFSQSTKQFIKYADELNNEGNYYGASIYYKKALAIDSSDIDLTYKYAHSLKNYNNYRLAEYYFQKITNKDKGGRIYKDASLWLASMQKFNKNYKESIKNWKKVKSLFKNDKKSYEYLKAKKEINSCVFAIRSLNDSSKTCEVENFGNTINTTASEFSGKLNNQYLEFSSLRADSVNSNLVVFEPNYKVAIYSSKKDTIWSLPLPIDTIINDKNYHNANGTNSIGSDLYIFSRCDSLSNCKLYYSKITSNKISKPIELPEKINAKGTNTTHPNIAIINDKKYLFFSSNRKGGQGSLDIWYSEILDGPTFSKATNAGKLINTPDPEITPYFNSKTNTLYFSSTWHNGFGGFDVFSSSFNNNKFSNPTNLLLPINSSWNDIYFNISKSQLKGVVTSNRKGIIYEKGPTCCNDLWEITFNEQIKNEQIIIKTLDDLNKYLPVTLYFHNDRPGPRSKDTVVALNYLTSYLHYKDLQDTYRNEYSKGLKDAKENEAKLDIADFFKHYVDKGVDDLKLFTKLLLEELEKGEKIEITVKGFASPLAKSDYNVNLTKRRISSLVNYLVEYDQQQFKKYINSGNLIFNKIPFGEYTSKGSVSDDYYDQRNSIYNRAAALERRIEIQTARKANYSNSNYAELSVEISTHDFGKLTKGELVKHTFRIKNTGLKELNINRIESSCGCTVPDFNYQPILPGEYGEIIVKINTTNLIGKQVNSITIISDAFPTTKRLVLTAEIFEK